MSFVNLIINSILISNSLQIQDCLQLYITLRKQKSLLVNDFSCLDHVLLYKLELNKNNNLFKKSKNDFNFIKFYL